MTTPQLSPDVQPVAASLAWWAADAQPNTDDHDVAAIALIDVRDCVGAQADSVLSAGWDDAAGLLEGSVSRQGTP